MGEKIGAFQQQESEFNSAASKLGRINLLYYMLIEHKESGNLHKWFNVLEQQYCETAEMMDKGSRDNLMKTKRGLAEKVSMNNLNHNKTIDRNLLEELESFEIELRVFQKKAGMGLKLKEGVRGIR